MADHKGFEIPRHTQTPNSFFDDTLPQIKSIAELKILLAVMRQTFGWRKFSDTISMSQLVKITGLTRQGVANGLRLALDHGFLDRAPAGQSFSYSLKLVKEIDQSSKLTSQEDRPEVVKEVDRQLVKEIDPQKKEEKEKKEREEGKRDFIAELRSDPLYSHVDFDYQLELMARWLARAENKGRRLTERFVLNWLAKVDRPVDMPSAPKQDRAAWEAEQKRKHGWDKLDQRTA